MVSIENLRDEFNELGVTPSDDILEKCFEICTTYNENDPTEFVESWMAYSVSNLQGAEPTLDNIKEFELKEYQNKRRNDTENESFKSKQSSADLKVYNDDDDEMENDLLGSYICMTPKATSKLQSKTSEITQANKFNFSPVSYSPVVKKSRILDKVSKSGNVVYNFGNFIAVSKQINSSNKVRNLLIRLSEDGSYMSADTKYLMAPSIYSNTLFMNHIYDIGRDYFYTHLENVKPTDGVAAQSFDDVLNFCDDEIHDVKMCLGRIIPENEKLDAKTCLFNEFSKKFKSRIMNLDFTKLKTPLGIIPGEICLVRGTNPRQSIFYVEEILKERTLEKSAAPGIDQLNGHLSIVIGSAPFTTEEDLLFEHLDKLMLYCKNNNPDILILTGSFLPNKSSLIEDMATNTQEHFEKMIMGMINSIGSNTHILIVASHDDINSSGVYPTHPYRVKINHPNLHLLPDPCVVDINGLQIGLTSVDVCKHIVDSELTINAGFDKIKRIINYMFHQKSFYPLYPPKISYDIQLINEFCSINKVPNIMVVPSNLKYFMKDINNCLCINPGRLVDSAAGGTFAHVIVQPAEEVKQESKNITNFLSGQIFCI